VNARKDKRLARIAAEERTRRMETFIEGLVETGCDCNWPDPDWCENGVIRGTACEAREVLGLEPTGVHRNLQAALDRRLARDKAKAERSR